MVLETHITLRVAEPDFLRKRFCPIDLENRAKIGFSEFIEKFWVTLGIP